MEVLRLVPDEDQENSHALVLDKQGDLYDIGLVAKNGDYTSWILRSTLPDALRLMANSIEKSGHEYVVEPGDDLS